MSGMTQGPDAVQLLKDLVRMDTSNPPGNERVVADYLAAVFEEFGIPYEILEPEPQRASIIARLEPEGGESAQSRAPILLISHTDVVAADPDEWSHGPFDARELDGMIYGRGTLDTKYLTATQLAAFLRVKGEPLTRPVYFVAAADEEQGSGLGMAKVSEHYGEAFAGGTVLNEGGGFYVEHEGRPFHLCTAGEKGRCSFSVTTRGDAGPSSFPADNNAVNTFLILMDRLTSRDFPPEDNPVSTRFDELLGSDISQPFLRSFSTYNKQDTFILKRYDAGAAPNVLPNLVQFNAQLQLLPSRTRDYAEEVLREVFDGLDAEWEITDFRPGFISDIDGEAFTSLQRSAHEHLGGAELLPVFALGQTDGRFLGTKRCNVYGFGPVTQAVPFSEVLSLVHQPNERVNRASVELGADIIERFIRDIGTEWT